MKPELEAILNDLMQGIKDELFAAVMNGDSLDFSPAEVFARRLERGEAGDKITLNLSASVTITPDKMRPLFGLKASCSEKAQSPAMPPMQLPRAVQPELSIAPVRNNG